MLSFLIIQVALFMTLGVTGECSWCPNQCVYCIRRLWVQFQSFILAGYVMLRFRYESWSTLVGSDSNEIFIFRASVLLLFYSVYLVLLGFPLVPTSAAWGGRMGFLMTTQCLLIGRGVSGLGHEEAPPASTWGGILLPMVREYLRARSTYGGRILLLVSMVPSVSGRWT